MKTTVTLVPCNASSIIFLTTTSPFFFASSQSDLSWKPVAALPTISPNSGFYPPNVALIMKANENTHLQILRRYRRPLLLCLEYAHGPSLENHVHRAAPMGARVLIKEMWYYTQNFWRMGPVISGSGSADDVTSNLPGGTLRFGRKR
jgi:hypothetical protein